MGAAAILQAGRGPISESAGWVLVAGLLVFVVNFAYSSGPLTWVVISEVFPMRARGKGAGVATACNWLSNFIVSCVAASITPPQLPLSADMLGHICS